MKITINPNYVLDVKRTRRLLNRKGFSMRYNPKEPNIVRIHLTPLGEQLYPNAVSALQNIELIIRPKNLKTWRKVLVIKSIHGKM